MSKYMPENMDQLKIYSLTNLLILQFMTLKEMGH